MALLAVDEAIPKVESAPKTNDVHFLLYGHKGWIGGHLVKQLQQMQKEANTTYNIKYTLGNVRVDVPAEVENEIKSVSPTHIISTIGRTHGVLSDGTKIKTIDYLESLDKTKENVHDNLFGPMLLALLCSKYDIHLTYLGTGCIYHYESDEKSGYDFNREFTEEDTPNFFGSQYSTVKGFTDQLMGVLEYNKNVLNVRIRMPITDELDNSRNLLTKLVSYKMIINIPNSMTNIDELIPVMIDMALQRKYGTINLCNPGTILHNEILKMYTEIVDENHTWTDVSMEELDIKAGRSNNALNTKKLLSWYPDIKPIEQSIRDTLIRAKKKAIHSDK